MTRWGNPISQQGGEREEKEKRRRGRKKKKQQDKEEKERICTTPPTERRRAGGKLAFGAGASGIFLSIGREGSKLHPSERERGSEGKY